MPVFSSDVGFVLVRCQGKNKFFLKVRRSVMKKLMSLLLVFCIGGSALCAIFEEDFQTWSNGDTLDEHGWSYIDTGQSVEVSDATAFGALAIDGGLSNAEHNVPYIGITQSVNGVLELSADVYVTSTGSYNAGLYFGSSLGGGGVRPYDHLGLYYNTQWHFDARGIADVDSSIFKAHVADVGVGADEIVHLIISLDTVANTVTGTVITSAATYFQTYNLPAEAAGRGAFIDRIALSEDRREVNGTDGIDVDNILVTPEPATMLLLGLGGLLVRRRQK